MDEDYSEIETPDTFEVVDTSAKVYKCIECGWESFMFDWNDDGQLEEQRIEAIRHARIEHGD